MARVRKDTNIVQNRQQRPTDPEIAVQSVRGGETVPKDRNLSVRQAFEGFDEKRAEQVRIPFHAILGPRVHVPGLHTSERSLSYAECAVSDAVLVEGDEDQAYTDHGRRICRRRNGHSLQCAESAGGVFQVRLVVVSSECQPLGIGDGASQAEEAHRDQFRRVEELGDKHRLLRRLEAGAEDVEFHKAIPVKEELEQS